MKSILLSIKPKYVELIASGQKTIEVRKTAPKEVPFKCYIYCTKQKINGEILLTGEKKVEGRNRGFRDKGDIPLSGKVIGEFICDKVDKYTFSHYEAEYRVTHIEQNAMCLNQPELIHYGKGGMLYGWHISDLKIYDIPKTLTEFHKYGAEPLEKLFDVDGLCPYCGETDYGEHKYDISSRWGMVSCEGRWCDRAYEEYLDANFALTRSPQSWQYVEDLGEEE